MHELTANLHIHTTYSDGSGTHNQIAEAALQNNLDVIIITDHNILVRDMDRYHQKGKRRLLMLVGEEIHDRTLIPAKNHMLVIGAGREMSAYGQNPQQLIDQVRKVDGLTFIAHPIDPPLKIFKEEDYSWENWNISNYTGLEIWNGFSELKTVTHSYLAGIFYAYFPRFIPHGPLPETLQKWDDLLASGKKIVGVGGSDAHALHKRLGPLSRIIFPYAYHFQTVNTHLLVDTPLSGDLVLDRGMVMNAFRKGHAFFGNDLPASTNGFRFTARGKETFASIGDDIRLDGGLTMQIRLPQKAECVLVKDGKPIKIWRDRDICTHIANQPGIYRVECYLKSLGERRGWIFSNPIYVSKNNG